MSDNIKVTIKQGTCSWTDPTLISGGKFYPKGCSKSADRLKYYQTQFPTVEVDSSTCKHYKYIEFCFKK